MKWSDIFASRLGSPYFSVEGFWHPIRFQSHSTAQMTRQRGGYTVERIVRHEMYRKLRNSPFAPIKGAPRAFHLPLMKTLFMFLALICNVAGGNHGCDLENGRGNITVLGLFSTLHFTTRWPFLEWRGGQVFTVTWYFPHSRWMQKGGNEMFSSLSSSNFWNTTKFTN